MADIFTIGGTPIDPVAMDVASFRYSERFSTIPSLTLSRRGIALPGLPDPWVGQTISWTDINGVTQFTGDVVSMVPSQTQFGWEFTYQCLGLRNRLDWFAHTDANSGTATSYFNLQAEDPNYLAAQAGRTVGEILQFVLTSNTNVYYLQQYGIGNITGTTSNYTLPTVTQNDLNAMIVIPPRGVYFGNEKLGAALDSLMQAWAPNYRMWIDRSGNFRFLDIRTFPASTLTMGTDPIEWTKLSRDVGDCFQRVVVRGQPIADMSLFKLSDGSLVENFAWGTYTNAEAKANFYPGQTASTYTYQDSGTCTCPNTTTVVITSSDPTRYWATGFWDASHNAGSIYLNTPIIPGYTQRVLAPIVGCTALSPGGTCTLTLSVPLPVLTFSSYTIIGVRNNDPSVVYRQYQIADPSLWPKIVKQSTYPAPFVNPDGAAVTQISTPMGLVLFPAITPAGFPVYGNGENAMPDQFQSYNQTTGNLRFVSTTYSIAQNQPPTDVWVALPIQNNQNTAVYPPNDGSGNPQYEGTSYTVDGLTKTLFITQDPWRDPAQLSAMTTYAQDVCDSVSIAMVEGSVTYYGYYSAAMTFGMALNIAGNDQGRLPYTTGWEASSISGGITVVAVDVEWSESEGMLYKTSMQCSTRRDSYSAEMFMHPDRTGMAIGLGENQGGIYNPYGVPMLNGQRNMDGTASMGGQTEYDQNDNAAYKNNGYGNADAFNRGMFGPGGKMVGPGGKMGGGTSGESGNMGEGMGGDGQLFGNSEGFDPVGDAVGGLANMGIDVAGGGQSHGVGTDRPRTPAQRKAAKEAAKDARKEQAAINLGLHQQAMANQKAAKERRATALQAKQEARQARPAKMREAQAAKIAQRHKANPPPPTLRPRDYQAEGNRRFDMQLEATKNPVPRSGLGTPIPQAERDAIIKHQDARRAATNKQTSEIGKEVKANTDWQKQIHEAHEDQEIINKSRGVGNIYDNSDMTGG